MQARQISFLGIDDDSLSIADVAAEMSVSVASVRNWMKTGYLQPVGTKRVSRDSYNAFRQNVAGSDKLTGRANKSHVDHHDHAELGRLVSELLGQSEAVGDDISQIYERSLSQSYRNLEGVYYTPDPICDSFFIHLPSDRSKLTFFDPCCGTGNFLLAALRAGFRPENVYGCDVDSTAIAIARKRMQDATGAHTGTIFEADFLNSLEVVRRFVSEPDVIFTNPPWGKKLSAAEKGRLASVYSCNKSLDTSAIFLMACRRLVVTEGYHGMLLPESFFNVSSFEVARRNLLADQLINIVDHGKPFAGILSPAVSYVAIKHPPSPSNIVQCTTVEGVTPREQVSFLSNPSSILNFKANSDDAALIRHLYALPYVTLAGRAKWALGIVTGNNKRHLSDTLKDGYAPVYRGTDIEIFRLKAPGKFIPTDMSGFQQVAPMEMYLAPEKIIYRFISSKLVFYHDMDQSLILNSANLLIPDEAFPVPMKLLAQYLSSNFMNWIFAKLFSTHKVLRSDIERLPIFADQLAASRDFDETTLLQDLGVERVDSGSYRIKK